MMKLEDLQRLNDEEKKRLLKEIMINDETYWQKVFILMNMEDDNGLLDKILDNKRAEMDLLEKKIEIVKFSFEELKNRDISKVENLFEQSEELNEKYRKACKELSEVFKYIPDTYYKKIDVSLVEKISEKADPNYEFSISMNTNLSEVELMEETKDILALIMNKYWAIKEKSEVIPEIKLEEKNISGTLMCEYKPKWYEKIFRRFSIK